MKTVVINLLGGSGSGKSTASCGLFYELKRKERNVELVREYVKELAWQGIKIGAFDQPYIFGKQLKKETLLYGKVQYIITDSPLILSPMYESFYNNGETLVLESTLKFLEKAKKSNVEHINFMLKRTKKYKQEGRYETEDQAREFDVFLRKELDTLNIKYIDIESEDDQKVNEILNYISVLEHKVLA